jgi:hypothetical protein
MQRWNRNRGSRMGDIATLESRLNRARRNRFVGREAEIALIRALIIDPAPETAVIWIWGPGGVGKSSLLDILVTEAIGAGVTPVRIDARDVERSPEGLRSAIRTRLGIDESESIEEAFAAESRCVLLIDTYEWLAPAVDEWMRETFLPGLPESTFVVLAGRDRPADAWRSDSGWASLMRVMPLRNLRPDEAERLLRQRQIDPGRFQALIALSHGHPLALSLLVELERIGGVPETMRQDPNLVRTLLERFIQEIPADPHRLALEVCAHARITTEALLREVLGLEEVSQIFTWLRNLSFVQEGPEGIFPHDLARDVIDADLRWRDLVRYQQVHVRVRAPIVRSLKEQRGLEQQRAAYDLLYLHRNGPVMGPFYEWTTFGIGSVEPLQADDLPAALAMIKRFEGSESAAIARFWWDRQPSAMFALREHERMIGFGATLVIEGEHADERAADPAIDALWTFLGDRTPLRPGECILYDRWSIDAEEYQEVSHTSNLLLMHSLGTLFSIGGLAWTVSPMRRGEIWQEVLEYLNMPEAPEAGFTVGPHEYAVHVHDWRAEPLDRWIDIMGEREIANERPESRPIEKASLLVLSRTDFDQAVRQALRDLRRPGALARNPLTRSRMVQEHPRAASPGAALESRLRDAARDLQSSPRDEKLYRAIYHTYLEPASTQELAAELLDLPFTTYRYHLSGGLRRISDALWELEIGR